MGFIRVTFHSILIFFKMAANEYIDLLKKNEAETLATAPKPPLSRSASVSSFASSSASMTSGNLAESEKVFELYIYHV